MKRWEIVKKQMQHRGIKNISELSKRSGVPYTTIRSMKERDFSNASIDHTIKICQTLGITVDELFNPKNEIEEGFEINNGSDIDLTHKDDIKYDESFKINLKKMNQSLDSSELEILNIKLWNCVNRVNRSRERFGENILNKGFYQLMVNNNSMDRILPLDTQITVLPTELEELEDEDIIIYNIDGIYRIGRYRQDKEDEVIIFSPESDDRKFRDTIIPFKEKSDLKFCGKVIMYTVTLD